MKEGYEDDEDEQEGPKSSFTTYLAEGDALFKQAEYNKALDSYTLALELQPNDKWCLVARSKCYLKLGDPQTALKDAEQALEDDKCFNKGLYQKAEALYSMGDFEYALMYYHRGHKLRPELDEFRLGIQKAQEAIDNSIGSVAKVKLENKGDLSFFKKQDDLNKKAKGYSKPTVAVKQKPLAARGKDNKSAAPSKQTAKQLLGELYADKEYLEKLMKDPAFMSHSKNKPIHNLVQDGLNYLETRTEFWRQQKPLYARRREKQRHSKNHSAKRRKQTTEKGKELLTTLEKIDSELANGRPDTSLQLALRTLKSLEAMNDSEVSGRSELVANCHSAIGNAYFDTDKFQKSLKHHQKDLELSKKCASDDGKSRALDNIGRVYVRMKKYSKAVASWSEKLALIKSPLESTWIYHEIGRCYMEMKQFEDARDFGERSLAAAKEAEDDVWQLNASVLVAQSDMKLNDLAQAVESFQSALLVADRIDDKAALSAIQKALDDIGNRINIEESSDSNESAVNAETKPSEDEDNSDSHNNRDHSEEEQEISSSEKRNSLDLNENEEKLDSDLEDKKSETKEFEVNSDSRNDDSTPREDDDGQEAPNGGESADNGTDPRTSEMNNSNDGDTMIDNKSEAEENNSDGKQEIKEEDQEEDDQEPPEPIETSPRPKGAAVLSDDEDGFYS